MMVICLFCFEMKAIYQTLTLLDFLSKSRKLSFYFALQCIATQAFLWVYHKYFITFLICFCWLKALHCIHWRMNENLRWNKSILLPHTIKINCFWNVWENWPNFQSGIWALTQGVEKITSEILLSATCCGGTGELRSRNSPEEGRANSWCVGHSQCQMTV